MKWDHSAERLLLLAILETHKISNIDYGAVADKIGKECSARAVYTRLWMLRRLAAVGDFEPRRGGPAHTPKRRKGSLGEEDEDMKCLKPRPFLQHKLKLEVKQEAARKEGGMASRWSMGEDLDGDICIIDG